MDKKDINLKKEASPYINRIKTKISTTMPNLKNKLKKKPALNYSKLKFKQNVLLNILRQSYFRKNKKSTNNHSKPKNKLLSYKINKKYQDIPGISKFHNLTNETINDLIKTTDNENNEIIKSTADNTNTNNSLRSYNITTVPEKINNKNIFNLKRAKTPFLSRLYLNKKNTFNQKDIIYSINNNFNQYSINAKKFNLNNLNELSYNINFTKSIPNLKFKNKQLLSNVNNISIYNNKEESSMAGTISSNLKRIKLNKLSKMNSHSETKKWLESIKEYIKHYDFLHRNSKVDRLRFYIEKPDECFEENVLDEKPGDKYQLFKNQIAKHKKKFENIINEIKLNQIKSEYLMKRYIFDLLSRKKKIY